MCIFVDERRGMFELYCLHYAEGCQLQNLLQLKVIFGCTPVLNYALAVMITTVMCIFNHLLFKLKLSCRQCICNLNGSKIWTFAAPQYKKGFYVIKPLLTGQRVKSFSWLFLNFEVCTYSALIMINDRHHLKPA